MAERMVEVGGEFHDGGREEGSEPGAAFVSHLHSVVSSVDSF